MKRILCLLLALVLCGCAVPAETTAPPETSAPPETTAPAAFQPYTVTRSGEIEWFYAGPGFATGIIASVIDQVEFWISEEAFDADGNLWGQVKAGHWLCLTDPAIVPIRAEYAPEEALADETFSTGETEYVTEMLFTAQQPLTDVTLWSMAFEEAGFVRDTALHTIAAMDTGSTFLAGVVFYGDMTTYGLSFTDQRGAERFYTLYISGMDGALVCAEGQP